MSRRTVPAVSGEREVNERWATWLRRRMRATAGVGTPTELGQASGVDQSVISRWLNEGRTPQVNQLRKIATPLRATMLDLLIAAGYVSPDELGVTDTPSSAVVADVAEAIKRDADLIDEARLHLLNQYALLRRLGPDEPSETPARKTSRRPASPDAPVARPIRAAARRGKPDRT